MVRLQGSQFLLVVSLISFSASERLHTIFTSNVHKFEQVLVCCEDEMGWCDCERGAVPGHDLFIDKQMTVLRQTKSQCLFSLAMSSTCGLFFAHLLFERNHLCFSRERWKFVYEYSRKLHFRLYFIDYNTVYRSAPKLDKRFTMIDT